MEAEQMITKELISNHEQNEKLAIVWSTSPRSRTLSIKKVLGFIAFTKYIDPENLDLFLQK